MYQFKRIYFCILLLTVFLIKPGVSEISDNIAVKKDIPYVTGEKAPNGQRFDVYYPGGRKECPVLLFAHGGGWKNGDKKHYEKMGRFFAAKGFVTVIINYRLSPAVMHPAHVKDCAAAFSWTHNNAKTYGGDPARIFLMGHSAGAHLVTLLTLDSRYLKEYKLSGKNVAGVIAISGPYLLSAGIGKLPDSKKDNPLSEMMEGAFGDDPAVRKEASPYYYVKQDTPPILLAYGQLENRYLRMQAKNMYKALQGKGAPVQLKEAKGKNHITIITNTGKPDDKLTIDIVDFINFRSYD